MRGGGDGVMNWIRV